MSSYALIGLGGLGALLLSLLVWALVYASGAVSTAVYEGDAERDDHELALSAQRARRREADAARAAGGAVPALSAREPGPRDPAIGVDQARAEVRARIHRYNRREVS
jgi:hypothetical protein